MTADRWQRIKHLFAEASDLPRERWDSFLQAQAGDDHELLDEVMSLLTSHQPDTGDLIGGAVQVPPGPHTATDPVTQPVFTPGTLVAGRYRISRFIGHGGMGQVFEAFDAEIRASVALKALHPRLSSDASFIERLKREVQLARRVSHPNVCRTFDLGRHSGGPDPDSGVLFLTMELLGGETLATRLCRGEPPPPPQALMIVAQLAAALDAAHSAGVVHRDLKPGNIFLVPNEDGEVRVVITDFGTAHGFAESDEEWNRITRTGHLLGTPAYMSPEQLAGRSASPAADIYSLGVVIHEMVTGELPAEDGPLGAPWPPRRSSRIRATGPGYGRRWVRVLTRCLDPDPRMRWARAGDIVRALRGEHVRVAPAIRRRHWIRIAWATAGSLLVIGGGLGWLHWVTAIGPRPQRPAVIIQRPINASGDESWEWIGTTLSEMIAIELAARDGFRVVPTDGVTGFVADAARASPAGLLDADSLAKLRSTLGVDFVISGSYRRASSAQHPLLQIRLRAQDTDRGEIKVEVAESAASSDLYALVARCSDRLHERLVGGARAPLPDESFRDAISLAPEVARLYSEGLDALRRFDGVRATELLSEAVRRAPHSPFLHAALADAWRALGFDERALQEARAAYDSSTGLPREVSLDMEARYREYQPDWARAIEVRRALVTFLPHDIEHRLRLSSAQARSGDGPGALATLSLAREAAPSAANDPRLSVAQAQAAEVAGDYQLERRAAGAAEGQAEVIGAHLLAAHAQLRQAYASYKLGEIPRALNECRTGLDVFRRAGNLDAVARALSIMAGPLAESGRRDEARQSIEEALSIYGQTGNRRGAARAHNNLGNLLDDMGEREASLRHYALAVEACREIGDRRGAAVTLGNLAITARMEGHLDEARRQIEEAIDLARQIGNQSLVAESALTLADVAIESGDLPAARRSVQEAITRFAQMSLSAELDGARLREARVELLAGDAVKAAGVAASVVASLERAEDWESVCAARSILALAALERNDLQSAGGASLAAQEAARRSQLDASRIAAEIGDIRVTAARGEVAQAMARGRALVAADSSADAPLGGDMALSFEAALCLGEIEMAGGEGRAGRKRLSVLAARAQALGFGSVAWRARRALQAR